VLPEHGDIGYPAKENEDLTGKQLLNLSNLAISVPELLFHPSDAGINCGGIHEALMETVNKLPKAIADELLGDIILIGGVSNTKGIVERFTQEVQENVSVPIKVSKSEE
jgi:actin-related protein 6